MEKSPGRHVGRSSGGASINFPSEIHVHVHSQGNGNEQGVARVLEALKKLETIIMARYTQVEQLITDLNVETNARAERIEKWIAFINSTLEDGLNAEHTDKLVEFMEAQVAEERATGARMDAVFPKDPLPEPPPVPTE